MTNRYIVAIDPGSQTTGFCLYLIENGKEKRISGTWNFKNLNKDIKYFHIDKKIREFIKKYELKNKHVEWIIEAPWLNKNKYGSGNLIAFQVLSEIIGVIKVHTKGNHILIAPNTWFSARFPNTGRMKRENRKQLSKEHATPFINKARFTDNEADAIHICNWYLEKVVYNEF